MLVADGGCGHRELTNAALASECRHSPSSFFMTHVLTFSQLLERSFSGTKKLLKTYILGALILLTIMIVTRGIAAGLFVLSDASFLKDKLAVLIPIVIMGLIFTVISVITQILLNTFGLVLATDRKNEIKANLVKSCRYFWKLILGSIWTILFSFF